MSHIQSVVCNALNFEQFEILPKSKKFPVFAVTL